MRWCSNPPWLYIECATIYQSMAIYHTWYRLSIHHLKRIRTVRTVIINWFNRFLSTRSDSRGPPPCMQLWKKRLAHMRNNTWWVSTCTNGLLFILCMHGLLFIFWFYYCCYFQPWRMGKNFSSLYSFFLFILILFYFFLPTFSFPFLYFYPFLFFPSKFSYNPLMYIIYFYFYLFPFSF
jgi:hypothetical protein